MTPAQVMVDPVVLSLSRSGAQTVPGCFRRPWSHVFSRQAGLRLNEHRGCEGRDLQPCVWRGWESWAFGSEGFVNVDTIDSFVSA